MRGVGDPRLGGPDPRIEPELARVPVTVTVPARGQQEDLAVWTAGIGFGEAFRADLLHRLHVAQVHHPCWPDHAIERRRLDSRRVGEDVRLRIDV